MKVSKKRNLWMRSSIVNLHMQRAGASRFTKCIKNKPSLCIEELWWDSNHDKYTQTKYSAYHMDEDMYIALKRSKKLRETTLKIMQGEYPTELDFIDFKSIPTPSYFDESLLTKMYVGKGFFLEHYYLELEDSRFQICFFNVKNHYPEEPMVNIRKSDRSDGGGVLMDIPSLYRFLNLKHLKNFKATMMCSSCYVENNGLLSVDEVDIKKSEKK
jgi:hypothetical protein